MEIFKEKKPEKKYWGEQANRFKVFILLSFAPFLAWYSNQSVNNPWRWRSSFYFRGDSIVFFMETNRGKSDEFLISVNQSNAQNTDIHGWEIRERVWGTQISKGDTSIIIADRNFEKNFSSNVSYDILVSTAETAEELAEERRFFRPKITIWFTENAANPPASNVHIPSPDENFRTHKRRRNFNVLPMK